MEKRNLDRISELTRIARERALTEAEQAERETLRKNYLNAFRSRMRAQLENTVVDYPDGRQIPLSEIRRDPGRDSSK